jgi:hypothetical protein
MPGADLFSRHHGVRIRGHVERESASRGSARSSGGKRSAARLDSGEVKASVKAPGKPGPATYTYMNRPAMDDAPGQKARSLHDGEIHRWGEGERTFISIIPERATFARETVAEFVAALEREAGHPIRWHATEHRHQTERHWHIALDGAFGFARDDLERALEHALAVRREHAREWYAEMQQEIAERRQDWARAPEREAEQDAALHRERHDQRRHWQQLERASERYRQHERDEDRDR